MENDKESAVTREEESSGPAWVAFTPVDLMTNSNYIHCLGGLARDAADDLKELVP